MSHKITVLVLGAEGMLGHVLYKMLRQQKTLTVLGTTRSSSPTLIQFTFNNSVRSLHRLETFVAKADYVINCIALLETDDPKVTKRHYHIVNTRLPMYIEKLAAKYRCKNIYISTDAVFAKRATQSNEKTQPNPDTKYGQSKYQGEPHNQQSLTIRSSLIGLDRRHHKGLLEWLLQQKSDVLGYTQVLWAGSTCLQLARFITLIITKNLFSKIRRKTAILHFAPLGPISKYTLLSLVSSQVPHNNKRTILPTDTPVIHRHLTSLYTALWRKQFPPSIKKAIQDLLEFEGNR